MKVTEPKHFFFFSPKISESKVVVDSNITSPGATLALGFMYIKTNNQYVADLIPFPETPFLLDYVKPEFLFSRHAPFSFRLFLSESFHLFVDTKI